MRKITQCLNKQLLTLCERSVQLEELSNKIMRFLPADLAKECLVGSFSKGCLVLTTTDAAWASQLRYAIPELRDKLRKEAGMYQLSSVTVMVIDSVISYKETRKETKSVLSDKAKATIIKESARCTYQPLQNALIHLGSVKE